MARRKRRVKKKPFIILFLIILLGVGSFGVYKAFLNNNEIDKPIDKPNTPNKNDEEEDKEKTYKLSLLATGDGLIHNAIFWEYEQSDGSYDFSGAVKEVKDIVSKYDLAFYNQETVFAGKEYTYSGYPRFNSPSEFGDAMVDAGFNLISLANNHSMDKGETGVLNTLKYWKNKDVLYSGMANSEEDRTSYQIKEKNNITYTMLAYTDSTNGLPVPSGKSYLVNTYDKDKVKKDIEAVRDKVDVLIVSMHWGVEYSAEPNASQKEMAEYLSSLGVDIIIGNHPHVLQPITYINDTLVIYSLGNFISNQYGTGDYSKLVGFMATLDITKTVNKDESSIKIDNLGGELIYTYYIGNPITTPNHSGHKVIPFSKMTDGTYNSDYKRLYTKYTELLQSKGVSLNITPLPN